jgi:ABC-2 type transport system ATP-binding protein
MSVVDVRRLSMTFRAPVRPEGLRAAMKSLVQREYRKVEAVKDVSFQIHEGEVVGFLGPNGAGKTTTLKILSGILHPTQGSALVLLSIPWKREPAFLKQIAMVRGSRSMSGPGELTVHDTLRFQQLIYEVPEREFRQNLGELVEMLDLTGVLDRQVRALSLGERMRTGLAMALIYRPRLLFLDEPTLGLDVSAVAMVRSFLGDYAVQSGATVLLTSHYMADVEQLCKRVILIDHGSIHYDGDLSSLTTMLSPYKDIQFQLATPSTADWSAFGEVLKDREREVRIRVPRSSIPEVTSRILAESRIVDLSVTDPPLESVIGRAYEGGIA